MSTTHFNPAMIILARESRGWPQAELAEKIGVSAANLSKIERGDIGVQKETIEKIGSVTKFPATFFQQPGGILPVNLSYRKRQKVAQKIITPIEAKCNIIQRHIQHLTKALEIKSLKISILEVTEKQSPVFIAQKLRKEWNITFPVINDLTHTIESAGIPVMAFDFGTERVDSRSILTEDKYPVILINSNLLGDRQRFTLSYELGHLIMHTFFPVSVERDINHEANQFAAEFLMPASEIGKDFQSGITIAKLGELKRKWKVSMIALLYRADNLGMLTENQKRYLIQQFNQLKIRRREPVELDIPAETPHLIRLWIENYQTKTKFSDREMASAISLTLDEYLELYHSPFFNPKAPSYDHKNKGN